MDLCDEPFYHHGFNRCSNEIWNIGVGEVEYQFSGIYGKANGIETNCVYTAFRCGLSDYSSEDFTEHEDVYYRNSDFEQAENDFEEYEQEQEESEE